MLVVQPEPEKSPHAERLTDRTPESPRTRSCSCNPAARARSPSFRLLASIVRRTTPVFAKPGSMLVNLWNDSRRRPATKSTTKLTPICAATSGRSGPRPVSRLPPSAFSASPGETADARRAGARPKRDVVAAQSTGPRQESEDPQRPLEIPAKHGGTVGGRAHVERRPQVTVQPIARLVGPEGVGPLAEEGGERRLESSPELFGGDGGPDPPPDPEPVPVRPCHRRLAVHHVWSPEVRPHAGFHTAETLLGHSEDLELLLLLLEGEPPAEHGRALAEASGPGAVAEDRHWIGGGPLIGRGPEQPAEVALDPQDRERVARDPLQAY